MGFRLTEDEAWERLNLSHTGIFTTLRRDGRPITLPVWFAVLDRAIYVRTPARSKKIARIRNDPRAYFLVESGADWVDLSAVTLEVRATALDEGEECKRAQEALATKYAEHVAPPGVLPAAVEAAYADMMIVRLDPQGRLNSWNNRALVRAPPQEHA